MARLKYFTDRLHQSHCAGTIPGTIPGTISGTISGTIPGTKPDLPKLHITMPCCPGSYSKM